MGPLHILKGRGISLLKLNHFFKYRKGKGRGGGGEEVEQEKLVVVMVVWFGFITYGPVARGTRIDDTAEDYSS